MDNGEFDLRECVLCGVDPGQVNNQMLTFVPNNKITAIVVKTSISRVEIY